MAYVFAEEARHNTKLTSEIQWDVTFCGNKSGVLTVRQGVSSTPSYQGPSQPLYADRILSRLAKFLLHAAFGSSSPDVEVLLDFVESAGEQAGAEQYVYWLKAPLW